MWRNPEKLMNLKALDPLKPFYRTLDTKFYREGREIPLRIYFPDSESYQTAEAVQKGDMTDNIYPVLLYIHGRWVCDGKCGFLQPGMPESGKAHPSCSGSY